MPTVPPPPPMPMSTLCINFKRNSITDQNNNNNNKLEFSECLWAAGDPEVQRACYFARTCLTSSPKECVFLKVDPILQTGKIAKLQKVSLLKMETILGPTCGMVALSMLFGGTPSADDLLNYARNQKYTNNGEMFSALWLSEALKANLIKSRIKPDKVRSYIYDGNLDSDFIKMKLMCHSMLLVPYDADRNHAPCNQDGHKAHWCLICGFLIEDNNDVSLIYSMIEI